MEDFQQSLELKKNQPIAMLYKGLTFFHRGLLKVCFCRCFCWESQLNLSHLFDSWLVTKMCVILYERLLYFPDPGINTHGATRLDAHCCVSFLCNAETASPVLFQSSLTPVFPASFKVV